MLISESFDNNNNNKIIFQCNKPTKTMTRNPNFNRKYFPRIVLKVKLRPLHEFLTRSKQNCWLLIAEGQLARVCRPALEGAIKETGKWLVPPHPRTLPAAGARPRAAGALPAEARAGSDPCRPRPAAPGTAREEAGGKSLFAGLCVCGWAEAGWNRRCKAETVTHFAAGKGKESGKPAIFLKTRISMEK